ncbi:MAG: PAS domain-containing protein [Candidatus Eisenbacteria bacterium]|nr:PAS domain-containing protein [Candidatus Eisenbacteria bacterium]
MPAYAAMGVSWLVMGALLGILSGILVGEYYRRRARRTYGEIAKSKLQLQAIFDGITDGLIIVDREFRIVAVNKAEAAFLGARPQDIVGKPCYEIYCRGDHACELCPAHETFATGKSALVAKLEHASGYHRKGVDVYTFPVKDEDGETVQAIQYIKDVTDRLKLQSQLREVEQMAGIGQMAANVAHEIRNPLIAVGGFARQLHEALGPEDERREYTSIILEEVTRLEQILREQLTLERHLQPVLAPVDINSILRDVRKLLSHGFLSTRTRLIGKLEDSLPVTMGDANQLKQAFLNVVNNSIQSMTEGGTVEMSTEQKGRNIVVTVTDTGPGIAPEVMSKLFVPFFTTRKTGSGLGMAVTRRIVENHGGTIEVESEVGNGTTVRISLPIIRSTQEVEHRARYGDRPERSSGPEDGSEGPGREHPESEGAGGSQ